MFFGLLALLLCLVIFFPKFAVQPTQRIVNYEQHFEKPLPYQVVINQTDIETTQGQDVKFCISVTGERIPDAFFVKSSQGQQMMQKNSVNEFEYTFKNLYNDLDFNVVGGIYRSQDLHITVHPNPALLSYRCDLHYPNYIHRENETLEGKTRLIVPQGTQVDFHFFTRDAENAYIIADSSRIDLNVNDSEALYSFTAANSGKFDFHLSNEWNTNMEPLAFSVDVLPDAYPDIRVESFDEQLSTDVYFSGLLTDDYGFTKLTFNCLIKHPQEKNVVRSIAFDASQTRTSFFYHFNMDSLGVMPGQDMEVFLRFGITMVSTDRNRNAPKLSLITSLPNLLWIALLTKMLKTFLTSFHRNRKRSTNCKTTLRRCFRT